MKTISRVTGRAKMTVLAVVVALVLVGTPAAFAANGQPFILGKANNVATKVTGLIGKVASGPSLVVKNLNGGAALGLQVKAGKAPLTVNAGAGKATNLNADKLDGQDASAFLVAGSKAADADKLDGRDSGTYLPGDLPGGTTVRGVFYLMSPASAGGQYFGEEISYGYRLPSVPTRHYIKLGDAVPAGCSGSESNPEAEPGHLCVFEGGFNNVTAQRGLDQSRRTGTGLFMASAAAGHTYIHGTWAVTAPTS